MAQPTYYPLWATEDTTLPNTDQTNKIRPKTTLREIGWDKGQIPSAEEFNWLFNNMYQWIYYLNEEALPTYLPINGTSLSFTGDITGTATWSGNSVTSVELSSATLNAATTSATANTLVKRGSDGSASFGRGILAVAPTGGTSSSYNADFWLYSGTTLKGSLAWVANGDYLWLYKSSGTSTPSQDIKLYSDRVEISTPRSSSSQGTNVADLTRKDYVDGQVTNLNNTISDLNTSLTNYINGRSTSSFATNGYWKDVNTGTIIQWGTATLPTTSGTAQTSVGVTFPITFPNAVYSINANPKLNQMNTSTGNITVLACVNGTTTGFSLWGDSNSGQDFSIAQPCYWIAIGR